MLSETGIVHVFIIIPELWKNSLCAVSSVLQKAAIPSYNCVHYNSSSCDESCFKACQEEMLHAMCSVMILLQQLHLILHGLDSCCYELSGGSSHVAFRALYASCGLPSKSCSLL